MKVYCNIGAGGIHIPCERPQEMELGQVLGLFQKMSPQNDFMGLASDAGETFQFFREASGGFRVELLDSKTCSFEFASLRADEVEALIKAAFAGRDLKETLGPAGIEWKLDHF